jgi:hypothetical protein
MLEARRVRSNESRGIDHISRDKNAIARPTTDCELGHLVLCESVPHVMARFGETVETVELILGHFRTDA